MKHEETLNLPKQWLLFEDLFYFNQLHISFAVTLYLLHI